MDPTEDLSARVLLKHILSTEPLRTPVSRSASQAPSRSGLRRSSKKDAEPQTPQNILRRSQRNRIHESITRKSLPATKRRTASAVVRKQASFTSMLFNDGETPRHLLRNILQTEPVKSPVAHEQVGPAELQLPSEDDTVTRTRLSIELSGLDLPDVTMGNVVSTAKGLSRKRPRRSLNVTAFEKRLKDGNDAEEESENSIVDHSSLSLSSSTSLSLKTPFVDVHTEKRGLQRRVSNRRKITEEEFSAALNKQRMGDVSRHVLREREMGKDTNSEGFTLALSKLSEPDITVDIVNCQTALYDHHDAMTSNFSIIASQDKPTVMASQLQGDIQEEEEHSEMERRESADVFSEEQAAADMETDEGVSDKTGSCDAGRPGDAQDSAVSSKYEGKEDTVASQTFDVEDRVESEEEAAADSQSEDADGGFRSEQEEAAVRPGAEDEGVARSPAEEEAAVESQTSSLEARAESEEAEAQAEEEAAAGSQSEEEEATMSSQTGDEGMEQPHTEEEGGLPETAADSQPEDASQSEEEEAAAGSQTEGEAEEVEVNKRRCDIEEKPRWAEEDGAHCQTDEDYDEKDQEEEWGWEQLEHISRRAFRSEGGLVLPVVKAKEDPTDATAAGGVTRCGLSDTRPNSNSTLGAKSRSETSQNQTGKPDWTEPALQDQDYDSWDGNDPAGRKNSSLHLRQVSRHVEVGGEQREISSEEEQEEEWDEEDDDNEEIPGKTPAFVREKINFFTSNPPASTSVFKNLQASTGEALPAAKPKQARRRRTGPSRKETVLPKTYLMSVFRHFAKTKVSADVFPVLNGIMDKFFDRVAEDLETYAAHAKRKTIEVEDVKLLLRRQGYINDKVPVEVLIEKYLRLEQRKILIPIATSENVVIPKIQK
ncbi:uncharacterized protein cenpt isoform 2-T2 [Anableps anableps]